MLCTCLLDRVQGQIKQTCCKFNLLVQFGSNCSIGTEVLVILEDGAGSMYYSQVLTWSLMGALAAMGNAGAVPLAVVIAFVSGVWPYLKIGAVLMCFLLPPERLLVRAFAWVYRHGQCTSWYIGIPLTVYRYIGMNVVPVYWEPKVWKVSSRLYDSIEADLRN